MEQISVDLYIQVTCKFSILFVDCSLTYESSVRVCTHDQNLAPLIIGNKISTLPKINVPPC